MQKNSCFQSFYAIFVQLSEKVLAQNVKNVQQGRIDFPRDSFEKINEIYLEKVSFSDRN